jgi:flagellar hook-length control protein FliK
MIAELMRSMSPIASADHRTTHGPIHCPTSPSMDDARHDVSRDSLTQPEAAGVSDEFTATLRRSLKGKSDAQTPTAASAESDFVAAEPEAATLAVTSPMEAAQATDMAVTVTPGFEPPSVAPGSLTEGGTPTSSDDEATLSGDRATLIRDEGDAGDAVTAPHVSISRSGDILAGVLPTPGGAALSTSVETFLAAHHHRMRGALGTPASALMGHARSDGDIAPRVHFTQMTAFAELPALAAEKAATETPMPFRLSGVNHHGASLAALPAIAESIAGVPPTADSMSIPALRATLAEVQPASAVVRDGVSAATPGEKNGAHTLAADSAALARTLSERVTSMAHNGVHEARLRLTPAELGDIGIVVRKSAMLLSVTLQVARPEVLGLVQGTAGLLRDMLSQRHTGEVQVNTGAMTALDGDGASGDTSKRRSRDTPENDEMPGLALGASERGRHDAREVFRL